MKARNLQSRRLVLQWAFALLPLSFAGTGLAQTQKAPATDSSVQASPIGAAAKAPADDTAAQASPINLGTKSAARAIRAKTAIPITLTQAIDSGALKNGAMISAQLSAPVATTGGGTLRAGTPVQMTVIETLAAGKIYAAGEFSLQVTRVGPVAVFSDIQTFRGTPGKKDVADSAPAVGTDASLKIGAPLTFYVQPPPVAANAMPKAGSAPGSVSGVAYGSAPPQSSTPGQTNGAGGGGTGSIPSGTAPGRTQPANTTTVPVNGSTPTQPTHNQ